MAQKNMISEIIPSFFSIYSQFLRNCATYTTLEKGKGYLIVQTLDNRLLSWFESLSRLERNDEIKLFFSSKSDQLWRILMDAEDDIFAGSFGPYETRRSKAFREPYVLANELYQKFYALRHAIEHFFLSPPHNSLLLGYSYALFQAIPKSTASEVTQFPLPLRNLIAQALANASSVQSDLIDPADTTPRTKEGRLFFLYTLHLCEKKQYADLIKALKEYPEIAAELHLHGKNGLGILSLLYDKPEISPSLYDALYDACRKLIAHHVELIRVKALLKIESLSPKGQESLKKLKDELMYAYESRFPSALSSHAAQDQKEALTYIFIFQRRFNRALEAEKVALEQKFKILPLLKDKKGRPLTHHEALSAFKDRLAHMFKYCQRPLLRLVPSAPLSGRATPSAPEPIVLNPRHSPLLVPRSCVLSRPLTRQTPLTVSPISSPRTCVMADREKAPTKRRLDFSEHLFPQSVVFQNSTLSPAAAAQPVQSPPSRLKSRLQSLESHTQEFDRHVARAHTGPSTPMD